MSDSNDNRTPIDPLTVGEMISLTEAAAYCGLSKHSLLTYARHGRIAAKKIGAQWVTTRAAVDEYMQSRNIQRIPNRYRRES